MSGEPREERSRPQLPMSASGPGRSNQRVGDYVLEQELAVGGMGAVYRARHLRLDRPVAIKMLLAGQGATPTQRERFRLEAQATARLHHPHIVAIHQVGEHQGCPYLVMDLIDGHSLEERVRPENLLEQREAARLIQKLAGALHYAHEHLILHRDVKPANVLLDPAGEPLLTDFGLAKVLDSGAQGPTRTGQLVGTLHYMAPEQAATGELVDARADVYALGATLYALLTGAPPFEADTGLELLAQVVSKDPVPPSLRRSGVERDLDTICLTCLEKEPTRRYDSAQALGDDLARALRGEPIHARPPSPGDRLRKWARRRQGALRVGAGALILLLAVVSGAAVLIRQAEGSARRSLAATARAAATEARARLDQPGLAGDLDARTGLALEALRTAQRWYRLEANREAARGLFEAAMVLGEVALTSEQWALSRQAFSQAVRLGVDDARADAGVSRVEQARRAESEHRQARIVSVLAAAERGELARQAEGLRDAVFDLVRYPELQTVELLARRVEDLAHELKRVELEVWLEAEEPTPREAELGGRRLTGLRQALEHMEANSLGAELPAEDVVVLDAAQARLARRAAQQQVLETPHPTSRSNRVALRLVGARQRETVGQGALDAVRIACETLGRIGIRQRAVEALGAYLRVEADELRAIPAALALCRLGGEEALRSVHTARYRHGHSGSLARRVERPLARQGILIEFEAKSPGDLVARAALRFAQGQRGDAIADLDRALELDPAHSQAFSNRGVIRQELGDVAGAIADFTAAIEIHGDFIPRYWVNRARARGVAGDVAGALADCDRAVQMDPNDPDALTARGDLRASAGDLAGGHADLNRALELYPRFTRALMIRGELLRAGGRLAEARSDFERILAEDPQNHVALNNHGLVLFAQGDRTRAIADFNLSLEADPGYVNAFNNRGYAREAEGDLEGALADFSRVLELDPTLVRVWANVGLIRRKLGDTRGAIEALERFVQTAPEHPQAGEIRGLLQQLRAGAR